MLGSLANWVAIVLALAGLGAIGYVPLFDGPGYESALAAGLILPSLAACATAVDVARQRPVPFAAFARGVAFGIVLSLLGLGAAWAHGYRTGYCDPIEGTAFYLLGPGFGAVLGGIWGAIAGTVASPLVRGTRVAFFLALAGPLAGIVVSLWRFYASPMVFAFDPFFGFFAGTLYDTVITGLYRLATYRIGTSLTIVAATVLFVCMYRDQEGHLRVHWLERLGLTLLGFTAAAASLAHAAAGTRLGHYQSTASIREALGHAAVSDRCEVVYPSAVIKRDAHALARECDAHVGELEKFFGVRGPANIVVFVFASAEQKGELMGAASTFIAKPWRREVYVQGAGYPHRVLRHELAHVIAGEFGRGPFRVAGPWGGLVPDPGLIEGVAVAAAPKEDDDLTLAEWAKAMKDLKLLPPLNRVFTLTFLSEPSSRAYTVAGAFIEWFRGRYGITAVKNWYHGERFSTLAGGKSLDVVEREWLGSLDKVSVTEQAMRVARARFDRPAIFGRRCPHVVDRLSHDADWALAQLDVDGARSLYESVLALDPSNVDARLSLGTCAERDGRFDKARSEFRRVADNSKLPNAIRSQAIEAMGDLDLADGKLTDAKSEYIEVEKSVVDDDHLRALDVKQYATETPEALVPIREYLVGDLRFGRDGNSGAAELGAWSAQNPKLGIADYLLARSCFNRGQWERAVMYLDRALARELPLASIQREAVRTRIILACALGDPDRGNALFETWRQDPNLSDARREALRSFLQRCAPGKGH